MVSKNMFTGGLKLVFATNLPQYHTVDQGHIGALRQIEINVNNLHT